MANKRKPNPVVDPNDYKPFGDYIMLEPQQEDEITEGGIVIPEQARKFLNEGKIIAKGPQVGEEIKVGLFVTFDSSSEYRLELAKDKVVFVIKESNIILTREDKVGRLFPTGGKIQHSCNKHGWFDESRPCPGCELDYVTSHK